jgi:hypothetical protein
MWTLKTPIPSLIRFNLVHQLGECVITIQIHQSFPLLNIRTLNPPKETRIIEVNISGYQNNQSRASFLFTKI